MFRITRNVLPVPTPQNRECLESAMLFITFNSYMLFPVCGLSSVYSILPQVSPSPYTLLVPKSKTCCCCEVLCCHISALVGTTKHTIYYTGGPVGKKKKPMGAKCCGATG